MLTTMILEAVTFDVCWVTPGWLARVQVPLAACAQIGERALPAGTALGL